MNSHCTKDNRLRRGALATALTVVGVLLLTAFSPGVTDVAAQYKSTLVSISRGAQIGQGWRDPDLTAHVGNLDGQGTDDLVMVVGDELRLYRGLTATKFAKPETVSTGWSSVNLLIGNIDWDEDGWLDLLARVDSGTLWVFRGQGDGTFFAGTRLGHGWNSVNTVVAVQYSIWLNPALIATDSAGQMYIYPTTGAGALRARYNTGGGWGTMSEITPVGDWDQNLFTDFVVIDSTGALLLYSAVSPQPWKFTVTQVGTGWRGTTQLANANRGATTSYLWRTLADGLLMSHTVTHNVAQVIKPTGTPGSITRAEAEAILVEFGPLGDCPTNVGDNGRFNNEADVRAFGERNVDGTFQVRQDGDWVRLWACN